MLKIIKINCLLSLIFILTNYSHSQECDTIITSKDTSNILYFYNNLDSLALGKLHPLNTKLTGFQHYNPLYDNHPFYAFLGNTGLAYKELIFKPFISNEFELGIRSFDKYMFDNESTRYYRLQDPYTHLHYIMGAKKEQMLNVKFHRKLIGNFGIGADIRFIYSPGYYPRQKSDDKGLILSGQFYSNDRRYGIIGNYIHNKIEVQENGGILNDSLFENNIETDRQIFPVNLNNAENKIKENGFMINQYFNLSKSPEKNRKLNINLGRITHTIHRIRQTQEYIDNNPASGFYDNIYIDSTQTLDSIYYYKLENQLTWSNLGYNDTLLERPFYVYLSARHRITELGGYMPRRTFNQISPIAGFRWSFLRHYHVSARGGITFGDYNDGNYQLRMTIGRWFGNDSIYRGKLSAMVHISQQAPDYFYQRFESNHFGWWFNFKNQNILLTDITYSWRRIRLSVNYYTLKNYVYLNDQVRPEQYDGPVNLLRAHLYKDFKIGKFNIINNIVYQKVSNNDIIRVPGFLAYVSFIFTSPIFKNAAVLQPGIDLFYNTKYYADAYMPALRSFYRQNSKEIGNYIYFDLYIMLKVKRARLFLKYQHLNSHFGNYSYYTVPHYPMQDAGFKFGVSWRFYD